MRWRLAIEEYVPELIYIKDEIDVVADALSRLMTIENKNVSDDVKFIEDQIGYSKEDDLPEYLYHMKLKDVDKYQRNYH